MSKPVETIAPEALADLLHGPNAPLVLDVRSPAEYAGQQGHIAGASLFPADRLADQLPELHGLERRAFVLVCQDGLRARRAVLDLHAAGFMNVRALDGGMRAWRARHLPVQR